MVKNKNLFFLFFLIISCSPKEQPLNIIKPSSTSSSTKQPTIVTSSNIPIYQEQKNITKLIDSTFIEEELSSSSEIEYSGSIYPNTKSILLAYSLNEDPNALDLSITVNNDNNLNINPNVEKDFKSLNIGSTKNDPSDFIVKVKNNYKDSSKTVIVYRETFKKLPKYFDIKSDNVNKEDYFEPKFGLETNNYKLQQKTANLFGFKKKANKYYRIRTKSLTGDIDIYAHYNKQKLKDANPIIASEKIGNENDEISFKSKFEGNFYFLVNASIDSVYSITVEELDMNENNSSYLHSSAYDSQLECKQSDTVNFRTDVEDLNYISIRNYFTDAMLRAGNSLGKSLTGCKIKKTLDGNGWSMLFQGKNETGTRAIILKNGSNTAYNVYGAIYNKFSLDDGSGRRGTQLYGYPTGEETQESINGIKTSYQYFDGDGKPSIQYVNSSGTFLLKEGIRSAWLFKRGFNNDPLLGLPKSDEEPTSYGAFQLFDKGEIRYFKNKEGISDLMEIKFNSNQDKLDSKSTYIDKVTFPGYYLSFISSDNYNQQLSRTVTITDIPIIMTTKLVWNLPPSLMNHWFENTGTNYYVKLNEINDLYKENEINKKIDIWKNDIDSLKKDFLTLNEKSNKYPIQYLMEDIENNESNFGKFIDEESSYIISNNYWQSLDDEHTYMHWALEKTFKRTTKYLVQEFGDLSYEYTGAIGEGTLRLVPSGTVKKLGTDKYQININEIGIYFRDSYDFLDKPFNIREPSTIISQPLGYWTFKEPYAAYFGLSGYIDNKTFRNYKGDKFGNFRIFSNFERATIKDQGLIFNCEKKSSNSKSDWDCK